MVEHSEFFSTIIAEAHESPVTAVEWGKDLRASIDPGELVDSGGGDYSRHEDDVITKGASGVISTSDTTIYHDNKESTPPAQPTGISRFPFRQRSDVFKPSMSGKRRLQSDNADSLESPLNTSCVIDSSLLIKSRMDKNPVVSDSRPGKTASPQKITGNSPAREVIVTSTADRRRRTPKFQDPANNVTDNIHRKSATGGRDSGHKINRQHASQVVIHSAHSPGEAILDKKKPAGKNAPSPLGTKERIDTKVAAPVTVRKNDDSSVEDNQAVPLRFIEPTQHGSMSYESFMQAPQNEAKKTDMYRQPEASMHIGRIEVIVEPPPMPAHTYRPAPVSVKSNASRRYLRRLS